MKTRKFKMLGVLGLTLLTLGIFQASAVFAEDPDIHHIWLGGAGTHTDGFTVNYPSPAPPVADELIMRGNFDGQTLSTTRQFVAPEEALILAPGGRKATIPSGLQTLLGMPEEVWYLEGSDTAQSPGLEFEGLEEWSGLGLALTGVQVPSGGKFALTNSSDTTKYWDSSQSFPQSIPGIGAFHAHYSWFFSAPGLYVLDVEFTGTKPGVGAVTSTGTYYACVTDDGYTNLGSLLLKLRNETITEPEHDELHGLIDALEDDCGGTNLHGVLGDDHGDPGEPGEGSTVELSVLIDESECFLTLGVASGSTSLEGGDLVEGLLSYTGSLPNVTVTSSCSEDWAVNGQATDFTSEGNTFGANRLGWTPNLVEDNLDPGHVDMGDVAVPGAAETDGLKVSRLLGESHQGGAGTAIFNADLALKVPTTTPSGEYSSTLTLSVFSGDDEG